MAYHLLPTRAIAVVDGLALLAAKGPGAVMSLASISEHLGLPPRYLENVAQCLVHDGVLKGVRGPAGGYRLGRPAEEIDVEGVLKAVLSRLDDIGGPTSLEYVWSPSATRFVESFEGAAFNSVTGSTLADLVTT